ncbi:hypothetical protein D3C75_622490 [compost metagenome]
MAAYGAADAGQEAVLCGNVFPETADTGAHWIDGYSGADSYEVGAGRRCAGQARR